MSVAPLIRWPAVRPRVTVPASTARSPRRARRTVAWAVGLFAAVQVGTGLLAEAYPRLRDPLYGDKFVKLRRKLAAPTPAGAKPATVVMLGSSRTGLAFHGSRAEQAITASTGRPAAAFNFGVPASGPVTHLIYLRRMLDAGVVPDLLVVEVLPSMVHADPGGPLERLWFYADRVTFSERATLTGHGFDPAAVRDRYARSVLLPAYTLRFQVMCRVVPSWLPWQVRFDWSRGADECGWGKFESQIVGPERRALGVAQARAEYAGAYGCLSPGGGAAQALRDLLAACKEKNIPARLVLMPEGTPFHDLYGPGADDRLLAFLREVSAEYDAPLTDARGWLPDEMFSDAHHMLQAGAEAFTDRLTRDAIVPALKPAR